MIDTCKTRGVRAFIFLIAGIGVAAVLALYPLSNKASVKSFSSQSLTVTKLSLILDGTKESMFFVGSNIG